MKSNFSRFLHHTLSYLGGKPDTASSLSYSDFIGVSRSNQVANLFHLDYRVKPDNDSVCAGRSMVEMLGVLAIIGVLSVGAISGYSKAMFKYKLNKQAEQMNTLINAVARNVHNFDNLNGGTYLTETFIKMGEIPTEMVKNNINIVYDIFGQPWQIFLDGSGKFMFLSSYSQYGASSLTTKSADNLEICKNILIAAKENSDNLSYMSSASNHSSTENKAGFLYGDKNCNNDNRCLKNLKLDDIYDFCTKHYGISSASGTELAIVWKR